MSVPGLPVVDVTEAAKRLEAATDDERPLVVDVRNPDEFESARIDGAVLMPLPVFGERYGELPNDRPLLLICHMGGRSAAATAHLMRNGYTDVANVAGGMDAWLRAGLPSRSGSLEPGEGELPSG
jgi:rhodanese-related sulfurtransferase